MRPYLSAYLLHITGGEVLKLLDRVEEFFCGMALLTTTIILFLNVVLRYVFKSSTSWAEELIKYLMIWIAFIGGSICVRKGKHVCIDFFYEFLSVKNKKVLSVVVHLIAAVFCGVMFFYGVKIIDFVMKSGQVSPALQIPMWIPYLAIPLGFILMFLRFIQDLIRIFKENPESLDTSEVN